MQLLQHEKYNRKLKGFRITHQKQIQNSEEVRQSNLCKLITLNT